MEVFVWICCLWFHIIDDYYLQGILSSLKSKSWWEENCPGKLYKNDYKIALLEHAFSWTFVIHIPLLAYSYILEKNINQILVLYVISFLINWVIHTIVDNEKANKKTINLIIDQSIHIFQITITMIFWSICIFNK